MEMRSRTTAVQLDRILEAINKGNAQQLSIQKVHSASLKNMTQKYFSLEGRIHAERAERLGAFKDMRACHTNSFQILHDYVADNEVKTGQEISKLWAALNSVRSSNSQPASVDSSSADSDSGLTSGSTPKPTLNSGLSPMSDGKYETDITDDIFCESVVLLPPTLNRECASTIQGSVLAPVPVPMAEVTSTATAVSFPGAHPEDPELEIEIAGSAPESLPTFTSIPLIRSNIRKKIPGHRKKTATCEHCSNEVGQSYLGRHKKNTCKMAKYLRSVGRIP